MLPAALEQGRDAFTEDVDGGGADEDVINQLFDTREACDDGVGSFAELVGAGGQTHRCDQMFESTGRQEKGGEEGRLLV